MMTRGIRTMRWQASSLTMAMKIIMLVLLRELLTPVAGAGSGMVITFIRQSAHDMVQSNANGNGVSIKNANNEIQMQTNLKLQRKITSTQKSQPTNKLQVSYQSEELAMAPLPPKSHNSDENSLKAPKL